MGSKEKRVWLLLPVVLLSMVSAGCWDLWELEERGLVLAVGIEELPDGRLQETTGVENQLLGNISDRVIEVTYQFAIPGDFSGQEGNGGPSYYNMTTTTLNSEIIVRGLAGTRSSRRGDLTHLQVMVLGQEVAKGGIYPVLERFIRDPEVRKQVIVLVTEGDVKEVLEVTNQQEPLPALYLTALMENSSHMQRIPPEVSLMKVFRYILEDSVYVIPKVTPGKIDSKLAGGGIFHGDRLVGWLGEMETVIYRWITNQMTSSPIVTASPLSPSYKLVDGYLAERSKTVVRPVIRDGTIKFILNIRTEGSLLERQLAEELWNDQVLASIRRDLAAELAGNIELLIKKAQEEWRLDIFGFGRCVEQHYPRVWAEIKDRWHDTYFPAAEFEVDVDITITRTGIVS